MTMTGNITFINAGAGSGKTYRLTEILFETMLSGEAKPEGVIATTFTRKAAAELRERARSKLMDKQAWELAHQIGAAQIGTVNSICGELLQRFAFEAGMSTDLRVLDENQSAIAFREALDAVMEPATRQTFNNLALRLGIQDKKTKDYLWESKIQAVVSQARSNNISASLLPSMAVANADDLLSYFGKPEKRDLNADLRARLDKTIPLLQIEQDKKSVVATKGYLELCEHVLKSLGTSDLVWSDWVKLAEGGVGAKSKDHVTELCLTASKFLGHPELHKDLRDYLQLVYQTASSAMEAYASQKRVMGVIDFIDQEQLLLSTLSLPSVEKVISEELDLLLVDEFQDTSPIQLAIFLKLAAIAKRTYWVGDPKQSIYGFRGSDPLLMQEVQKVVTNRENLGDSWRSTPALVALSNAVFTQAFEGQYPESEISLKATREDELTNQPAFEHWLLSGSNDPLRYKALAKGVFDTFQRAHKVIDKTTKSSRQLRYADIAILTRSNDKVTAIAAALSKVGIPVSIEQSGLLGTPEVVLAIACLRRLNDPKDTLSTAEIVTLSQSESPEIWLPDRLEWLKQDDVQHYLWKETGEQALPIMQQLAAMRSELAVLSPREAMQRVITMCNLSAIVMAWTPDEIVAKRRLANLEKILELSGQYEDECSNTASAATVSGLLLWLNQLAGNAQDVCAMPTIDAVQIMTYHKSKGLEWPMVICYELLAKIKNRLWDVSTISTTGFDALQPLNGRFIRYWPWPFGAKEKVEELSHIDESAIAEQFTEQAVREAQRLLYVGMTRARDSLVFALPNKTANEGWLGGLGCGEWFKPIVEADNFALPDSSSIPYRCELIQSEDDSISQVTIPTEKPPFFWFQTPISLQPRASLTVSPSSLPSSDRFIIVEQTRLAERIPLAGSIQDQMDRVGTGLHACIAYAISQKIASLTTEDVDKIMSNLGMSNWGDNSKAAEQLTAFLNWIQAKWSPLACHAEIPVKQTLGQPQGQELRGQIDLLLETEAGWILIDHKSNPGGSAGWEALAFKYGDQLKAYQQAIEAATDKPVLESWLYLPVSGGAIRIGEKL